MSDNKLKKWEAALALSLCITVCHGLAVPSAAGCNWWGVVFPGLAEEQSAAPVWMDGSVRLGGVELRLRLLDWAEALFK